MTIAASDFGYICDLVRQRSAIVLEPGKEYLVESRLSSIARDEGFGSLDQLVTELRTKPLDGLHRRVVEAMTTNETTFFRDVNPFDALRHVLLPELIEKRAAQRTLSIWCAACSSGQEPYSVAMLIREHFPALAGWPVQILATDLSGEMLERAREGRYNQLEINRGLPAPYMVKYFQKQGNEWQIKDELRNMIEFRELNLIEPWNGILNMDIVLLRNVLIYFDLETKRRILGQVRRILRPDGCLFLGGAESTMNLDDNYQRIPLGKAVCYRVPQ